MRVYRINFVNQGKVYEIYARRIHQGELYGFVEIEDLIFEESSTLLVDPSTEKLKDEFKGVERTIVPIHSIIRIDAMEKEGQSKIREVEAGSNITPFPSFFTPGRDKKE